MVALQRLGDLEMAQQLESVARIFAVDDIRFLQHPQHAQRDVLEIADRRGAEIEHAFFQGSGVLFHGNLLLDRESVE